MKKQKKIGTIAIMCSGGDAPGTNAAIRAVVRTGIFYGIQIKGVVRGFDGLIDGDFVDMDAGSVSNIIQKGGSVLKSSRSKRFFSDEGMKAAHEQLIKHNIGGVILIGGNGSLTGANVFAGRFRIPWIGIPKTIDNDLFGTDFCIGYDTAVNTAMQAIDKIKDTADAHDKLFFVEVMGRDAGFIALQTGIAAGAEAILVPETGLGIDGLIRLLQKGWTRKKSSMIVIIAEGNKNGGAMEVAKKVKEKFSHYDIGVCVLGHTQRGGSPTCMDRVLASELGVRAVEALMAGKKGVMVGEINKKTVFTSFDKATSHKLILDKSLVSILDKLSV